MKTVTIWLNIKIIFVVEDVDVMCGGGDVMLLLVLISSMVKLEFLIKYTILRTMMWLVLHLLTIV